MKLRSFALLSLLAAALIPAACSSGKKADAPKTMKIAVIPKGMTHEFWNAIHAGAVKAGRELGVEVIWKGANKEDDRAGQISVVEDMINRGVDGIVLAPLDNKALIRPVEEAVREKIPVVIIDSPLLGGGYVSYIATDNFKGGVLGARRMGELLGGKGKIFLIRCLEGSESSTLREDGFLETTQKEFPDIEFLTQDIYAGVTVQSAFQTLENLLNRFPDVEGIFCPNESTSFGTLRALESRGLAGKVKFVGFDSSQKLVDGLRLGTSMAWLSRTPSPWATWASRPSSPTGRASPSRPRSTPAKRSSPRRTSTSPRSRLSSSPTSRPTWSNGAPAGG